MPPRVKLCEYLLPGDIRRRARRDIDSRLGMQPLARPVAEFIRPCQVPPALVEQGRCRQSFIPIEELQDLKYRRLVRQRARDEAGARHRPQ